MARRRYSAGEHIPLVAGAYQARSLIADAQRCVNLYPEQNPPDSPVPFTDYLTPGLKKIFRPSGVNGCVRGAYRANNGAVFVVINDGVYFLDLIINYGYTRIGTIAAGTTPVYMSDNGVVVVLVDGSASGYVWSVGINSDFKKIVDAAFYGANFVAYLDGFFVFNRPATNQFYISPNFWNGTTAFDALDIAQKIGGADQIVGIAVVHREIWLIGQVTTEVWYNSGGTDFPFERLPGVFLEHGMLPGWSLAQADVALFYLGRDRQGQAVVYKGAEYHDERISTHAVEEAMRGYATVRDAVGFTYQQEGHTFYVLTFPTADKTWVFDLATGLWHERVWTDSNGVEHRIRPNACVAGYNRIIVGDWQTGWIYEWSLAALDDAGDPIVRRRGFPHMIGGGNLISYDSAIIDMDVGGAPGLTGDGPSVLLRWSDTRGNSWSDPVEVPFGATGEYDQSMLVRDLGMARDRVFEVFWDFPYETALQGLWVAYTAAGS
jgi:hypothetical protein